MFADLRPSMATAALRRNSPAQSHHETSDWQERDLCELSTDAQLAVRIALTRVLTVLKTCQSHSPKRATKRRKVEAPRPYDLPDLPVAPLDGAARWD